MKKITKEASRWLFLNSLKNHLKHKKRNVTRKNGLQRYHHILMPEMLRIDNYEGRQKTLDIIKDIKNSKGNIYIDFINLKVLTPVATILFVQNLEKILMSDQPSKVIRGRQSNELIVRSMLTKLRIHDYLQMNNCYTPHRLVDRWYIFEGDHVEFDSGYDEIENVLMEKFEDKADAFEIVNSAISEAVSNVVSHAYPTDAIYKKWKIFLSINEQSCHIVVSDLGQTIPNNIQAKITEQVLSFFKIDWSNWGRITDSEKIKIASEYKRSQTQLTYRGKGFENMMQVTEAIEGSSLTIYSRNGLWDMRTSKKDTSKRDNILKNYDYPINGTVIYWMIPLDNLEESIQ